ncbi:glycosyltransferase family 4 protein [Enterovirga aerilata]|uniref:Glycosyltransferase family 4 protein n=1 Tax=Enterovirga aerilata TaxID=2730920 RepID=A0A849I3C8_9HYPH|nr:glycosyltransferase family 4 protein [Enterovirga sp. DB1703]NNM72144.1 glycosyltransferase family 4 protein [Enterovirga sp. DB1703]
MRILLANTGHPATIRGGAEAAVLDLAHALAGRGHEVALVVHHAGRELRETEDRGVRVHALPNRNLYFGFDGRRRPAPLRLAWHALDSANPLMAEAFGRILDREKPDILNTHVVVGLSQLVWREAARRGVPIVHYLHEYGTMCPRGSAFRDGRLCASPCMTCSLLARPRRRLSRLVGTVVGVSRFTLQRHLDWGFFPNARTAVIPNVFQGLAFRARPPARPGPLRLGYFGRLIPDKGAHLLLEALRRLPQDGWTLAIAGTGEESYVSALEAASGPNVRFLGWTGAEAFFPQIDLLVLPSIWPDPQPRVTFEAFSHGVPVLGSRAGGIPEEIDEGETGWLFDAGSAEDLARVLAARIADRADRAIGPAALAARLARLQPDRVLAEYERVFEEARAGGA